MTKFDVAITNVSGSTIKDAKITISNIQRMKQIWSVTDKNGVYSFPSWIVENGGLANEQTHSFGFIVGVKPGSQPTVAISALTNKLKSDHCPSSDACICECHEKQV